MDPILEEMKRSREMRPDRFRTCVDYLCALVAAKDDKIAALESRIEEMQNNVSLLTGEYTEPLQPITVKRGPGRPRKEAAHA
jgi:hypothetical protein